MGMFKFDNIIGGTWKPLFFDKAKFEKICRSLTMLPEGLGNLTSLTKLDLWGCQHITTLPEGLGNLTFMT